MDFWYIFFMPDASAELFNWDESILFEYWGYIIVLFIFFVIMFKIWYYFFTLPNPQALKRFWMGYIILGLVLITGALIFILSNTEKLAGESQTFNIFRFFWLFFILLLDYVEISIIISLIIFLISKIPFLRWQIRAMRRYPFHFVK